MSFPSLLYLGGASSQREAVLAARLACRFASEHPSRVNHDPEVYREAGAVVECWWSSASHGQRRVTARVLVGLQGPEPGLLAAEINALPERAHRYVHDLETWGGDPACIIQENAALRESVEVLTLLLEEARGEKVTESR